MEWFWLIFAAVLGGIGNGLAGISAATVLVPVLIVLCPTFSGEAGAFQATTLALTCDILSSAVTAAVYIRHGNIDLRRGWVMLVCVWATGIAGSIAAWLVGGAVLGGFCLVLTFCIGIRYLVKPDSDAEEDEADGDAAAAGKPRTGLLARLRPSPRADGRLDGKTIGISLFFGLTIGFGTGFVGTGGGMMMFIVFTAFLGYTTRKAVGTATFIMTGTALIASVAHYAIDATLILEHLDMVIACVAVATVTSLVSAQFANRVSGKPVGITTGVILTALGASMIVLNYRDFFAGLFAPDGIASLVLQDLGWYLAFLAPVLVVLIVIKLGVKKLPREVFRKLLHAVAFSSGVVLAYSTDSWLAATIAAALFAIAVYPLLAAAERWKGFAGLFNQRHAGEVKVSLLLLFGVSALVIALCWGLAGQRHLVAVALLTWGFGDAAAGLIGRRFGKHKTGLPIADPNKTWEGSAAFAVVGCIVCAIVLAVTTPALGPLVIVGESLLAGVIGAFVELVSRGGNDTVSVPLTLAVLFIAMSFIP